MNTTEAAGQDRATRWSTLNGGQYPERQQVIEGWLYAQEATLPKELTQQHASLYFITVLKGEVIWVQRNVETKIQANHILGARDVSNIKIKRGGDRGAHIIVWRIQQGALAEGMQALNLPSTDDALSWPFPPRPLTPQMMSLFLELRATRLNGPARIWWYYAKLLELTALLYPEASPHHSGQTNSLMRAEVRKAMAYLQEAYPWHVSLDDVARDVGMSSSHLSRIFHKEVGMSLSHYLRSLRMEKAAQLLRTGESNVTDAAMAVGYTSISQFSGAFRSYFGVSPRNFMPGNNAAT
ncbi:helix-turn-helix transcriptional regulator [Cerasicoccus frondis]|uniref:helix-turn-helix transcriptional regulator n=1 Tax=Cerasicoccus frondis TaxID=490090 RepID=UPI002852A0B8|nr:helix-turn-helix transcriptional regulator [Cerasicoccus frondis]